MDALRVVFDSVAPRMPGRRLLMRLREALEDEVHPVKVVGECVGAVIVKGTRFTHACCPRLLGCWSHSAEGAPASHATATASLHCHGYHTGRKRRVQ